MSKKIFFNLMLISLVSVLVSTLTLSFLFQDYFIDSSRRSLESALDLYIEGGLESGYRDQDIRIEVLEEDRPAGRLELDRELGGQTLRASKLNLASRDIFIASFLLSFGLLIFLTILASLLKNYMMEDVKRVLAYISQSIGSIFDTGRIDGDKVYRELVPLSDQLNLYKEEAEYYILKLRENEKFRRDFTANISHELKTPLTSINGYAEMIALGMVDGQDTLKFARIINSEGRRLLALIDSIIDLSNLDDPNLELRPTRLDLYEIVETVSNQLEPELDLRQVSLSIQGEPAYIQGDYRMIQDLVFNLVDNAIKYNRPGGRVDIIISPGPETSRLQIRDTGIGIGPDHLERIFERFYVVDQSRSKNISSTGLGLAIVKHIAELHRAKLDIQSQPGQGSQVSIDFRN